VLAIPNDIGGYGDQLLTATRSGVSAPDAHTAAEILARWLAEWQASGCLPWRGNTTEIARYTTREQTGRLAALLDHAISVEPSTGAPSPELASALG
jgi:hypothetical protein